MGRPVPWSREDMVHVVGHPGTQQDDMGNGTDPGGSIPFVWYPQPDLNRC